MKTIYLATLFMTGCVYTVPPDRVESYQDKILSSKEIYKEVSRSISPTKAIVDFIEQSNQLRITLCNATIVDSAIIRIDSIDRTPIPKQWYLAKVETVGTQIYKEEAEYKHAPFSKPRVLYGVLLQDTTKSWSRILQTNVLSFTNGNLCKSDKSILRFKTDAEGRIYFDVDQIVNEPYDNQNLGVIAVNQDTVGLIAPLSFSLARLNLYASNNKWDYVKTLAQTNLIDSEIRKVAKEKYIFEFTKNISKLISQQRYDTAQGLFVELYNSNCYDMAMISEMRTIPTDKFTSYDLSKVVFSPVIIYPPPKKGTVVEVIGPILQVEPNIGFLLGETGDTYSTVSRKNILENLYDGRFVRAIGVYKGTKSYITVSGATRTVPLVEIFAIGVLY